MSTKWFIFTTHEIFGPWSASRIRDELRAGRIDTFDLASSEKDGIRRPLIEIDGIFETSRIQPAAVERDVSTVQTKSPAQKIIKPTDENALKTELDVGSMGGGASPRKYEALASPEKLRQPGYQQNFSLKKQGFERGQYLIWPPGLRPQGPFRSQEVLTLWYAGRLPSGTSVQRIGHSRRMDLRQFVLFYERATPSSIAFLGQASLASSQSKQRWLILSASIILAIGILLGALLGKRKEPRAVVKPLTAPPLLMPIPESLTITPRSTPSRPLADKPSLRKFGETSGTKKGVRSKSISEKTPKKQWTTPPQQTTQRAIPPPRSMASSIRPIRPVGGGPKSSPTPRQPTRQMLSFTDGQLRVLKGYRYNPNALRACQGKCKLPMTGSNGPVLAVFFKDSFAADLIKRVGVAQITGVMRRDPSTGAWSILLQRVD